MVLVNQNGSLLTIGSALASGQECCCQTPITNCELCCGGSSLPDELSMSVEIDFDSLALFHADDSLVNRSTTTGPASFYGVVVFEKTADCSYLFSSCGAFGDFNFLEIRMTVFASNGQCFISASAKLELQGCFWSDSNQPISNLQSVCCEPKTYGGGWWEALIPEPFNVESSVVEEFRAASPLCGFYYSRSATVTKQDLVFVGRYSGGEGKFRTVGDCACDSYTQGSFLGNGLSHVWNYSLTLSAA